MCYFKQGTISRMLFRGMLFALLAVCYPEYSRAVIAEDYQANRLITLSMKNISVADIIGQIRKTTDYRFLFQVDDLKGVRKEVFEVSEATIREAMDKLVAGTSLTYTLRQDGVVVLSQTQPQSREFTVSGFVLEAETRKPIPYATVFIPDLLIGTSAREDGAFTLNHVRPGKLKLEVRFMGRISLDTVIQVNANVTNLRFYLQEENFRLNEVHITAENSKAGQATSSKISRLAMDHMQATSLGDVMQLLPGGLATNPNLGYASQLNLRMISENASGIPGVTDGEEEAANMNSLGTLIIRDGAPVSNNANLQTVSPAITGAGTALGGTSSPAGGVDVRAISTDNIESIEVIRGIPSVEYGDLTSGAVIINSKAGREPFRLRFKTNENIYQVSAGKGFNLGGKKGSLNISGDYAYNVTDPMQSYVYYQRAAAKVMYSNIFLHDVLRSNTSVEVIYGDNKRKQNPDDERLQLKSNGRDLGIAFNTNGIFDLDYGWLKNLRYTLAVNYMNKKSYEQRLLTNATYQYSMTTTDGAILSNRPGVDLYDDQGNKLTNIPAGEETLYANMLPNDYLTRYDIEGKELNVFAKVMANFVKQGNRINNRILVGADFKSDGNNGDGKTFDPATPPYRVNTSLYSSFRPRKYSDIPFVNQLGVYAEENFSLNFARRNLNLQLGIRYDKLFGHQDIWTPRLNASLDVLPKTFTLRGGYGETAKMPTVLYLHPEKAYFEMVNFVSLTDDKIPEAQRLMMTTTRVFDTENKDLEIAKNRKAEVGFDLNIKGVRLAVTAFQERMNNGYSMAYLPTTFKSVENKQYKSGELPADGVTAPALTEKGTYRVLMKYMTPQNNITINTRGLEFDLNLGRFEAIRTAFSVNGAWLRTERFNNGYTYYEKGSEDPAKAPHVGIYEAAMRKNYSERMATTFRVTHNIPDIGFVVTLSAQVLWKEANWSRFGNDSIPVSYISKEDGQVYPFDPAKKEDAEFTAIMRTVNQKDRIRESMPPTLCMNLYLTKEIKDYLRVSFFANNMFSSRPLYKQKRTIGSYERRNIPLFFGLELSAIIN